MIGWPDLSVKGEERDEPLPYKMAYPDYKYQKEYLPMCLYIPTDEIMVKIIRMCIYVDDVKQLFIYNEC